MIKLFVLGASLKIGGGILAIILMSTEIDKAVAFPLCISMVVVGFGIQVYNFYQNRPSKLILPTLYNRNGTATYWPTI